MYLETLAKNHKALVGIGFLLGSLGLKALTSKPAKRVYVKGIVCGLKAKESVNSVVEEAKAEFDDLMAEAEYEHAAQSAENVEKAQAEPAETRTACAAEAI